MEANKEAAESCAEKAQEKANAGDYEAAEKFAEKALRLHQSNAGADLLETIRHRARRGAAAKRVRHPTRSP